MGRGTPLVFCERTRAEGGTLETQENLAYALTNPGAGGRAHSREMLDEQQRVRRLMPVETERLQGFPDSWTLVPKPNGKLMADSPRYRMIGNSMAVPVLKWIGERIQAVRELNDHA